MTYLQALRPVVFHELGVCGIVAFGLASFARYIDKHEDVPFEGRHGDRLTSHVLIDALVEAHLGCSFVDSRKGLNDSVLKAAEAALKES